MRLLSHVSACAFMIALLTLSLAAPAVAATVADLHLLDPSTGARCLDGSPSGYYFQPALSEDGKNTWVIHLEGGGECASQESCQQRIRDVQGSSKYFPQTRVLDMLNSVRISENPDLHGVNHVLLPYCQGDLWSGTVTQPSDKTWGFFFAGHLTVLSAIDALKRDHGLADSSSTRIIVAGDSAGGIGSWINADHIAEKLFPSSDVSIASFAGFYFTAVPYDGPHHTTSRLANFTSAGLTYNTNLWSSFLDQSCVAAHKAQGADPALCLLANNSFPYVSVPSFAFESLSDAVQLTQHFSVPEAPLLCRVAEQRFLEAWRGKMLGALSVLTNANDSRHGVFAPACWVHVFLDGPVIQGSTAIQAYGNWLNKNKDSSTYKMTDRCQGNFCNPSCKSPCGSQEVQNPRAALA